jgi:hypothetical protein
MKPKTQLQIEVDKLSKRLPKIRVAHEKWASLNLFESYVYRLKDQHTCFECGHTYKPILTFPSNEQCPKCKRTLKSTNKKVRKIRNVEYFSIIDTFDRFQIVRYFHVTKHWYLGYKPNVWINEVVQHWISPEGKNIIRGLNTCMNSWGYNDGWAFGSELAIRSYGKVNEYSSNKYYINTKNQYPKPRFINDLRRNGFKDSTHGYNNAYFFSLLLSTPMAETLLKAKQYSVLSEFINNKSKITENWASIKICIRNGYKIANASDWFDHLTLLKSFGKDVRNPKYICPTDFKAEHRCLVERRLKIEDADRFAQQQRIKAENEAFHKAKKKLFNLVFANDNITIVALKTVADFKLEGELLNHCVYASKYYEKDDSLIMSARMGDQRLETIQISLRELKVLQARGLNNEPSKYHKEILNLVNQNINAIRKALKQVA